MGTASDTDLPAPLAAAAAEGRVPRALLALLETLRDAGHPSYVVGGAVRDLLLGRPSGGDFDVATPATPEQVQALFPRTVPTGLEHGTVTVLVERPLAKVEVTTFRGEGAYEDGRRPSSVTFLPDVEGDLARRDFTVNALAWDPLAGALRDPFGGRADLAAGLLRAVGDPAARFGEDGLRPLRAARFAAQLGFTVEPATRDAIRGALPVVSRVSAERVSAELGKLVVGPHAAAALRLLDETGLLAAVLPEVGTLPPDARAHALHVAAEVTPLLPIRLAALLHLSGGEAAPPGAAEAAAAGAAAADGEDPFAPLAGARTARKVAAAGPDGGDGADRARVALVRLRFPAAVAAEVAALVRGSACALAGDLAPPEGTVAVRRWLSRAGPHAGGLLALRRAEAAAAGALRGPEAGSAALRREGAFAREVAAVLEARPPLALRDLALDGAGVTEALGGEPGPRVGEALRHLLDLVLEEPARNSRATLLEALEAWRAERSP